MAALLLVPSTAAAATEAAITRPVVAAWTVRESVRMSPSVVPAPRSLSSERSPALSPMKARVTVVASRLATETPKLLPPDVDPARAPPSENSETNCSARRSTRSAVIRARLLIEARVWLFSPASETMPFSATPAGTARGGRDTNILSDVVAVTPRSPAVTVAPSAMAATVRLLRPMSSRVPPAADPRRR